MATKLFVTIVAAILNYLSNEFFRTISIENIIGAPQGSHLGPQKLCITKYEIT